MGTLKPHGNESLYSNMVSGTLAVDWWAVTFGTARRGLAGCGPARSPARCTKCNSPPINGQCTNFILFDVALTMTFALWRVNIRWSGAPYVNCNEASRHVRRWYLGASECRRRGRHCSAASMARPPWRPSPTPDAWRKRDLTALHHDECEEAFWRAQ